jgi:hypothetical protein
MRNVCPKWPGKMSGNVTVFRKWRLPAGAGGKWLAELLTLAAIIACAMPAFAEEEGGFALAPEYSEFYGEAEGEANLFLRAPRFAGQRRDHVSFAIEPTAFAEWADGDLTATFTPFARVDSADTNRTHADIREAKFDYVSGDWDATLGIDTVFWGKTEAVHLVDIINQTDAVEDLDDEAALGQPMVRVAYLTGIGKFSAFYLPYVRLRTVAGAKGRLRGGLVVNNDQAQVNADGDRFAPSFALRYAGVIGDADIGLSAFHGVSRDPGFAPTDFVLVGGVPTPTALAPIYNQITQVGFDGQYTAGPMLYKGEAIFRTGQTDLLGRERDFVAFTGGVEYTLFSLFDNADLGLIGEYAFDSRGDDATSTFQNDIIVGARLALNDEADTSLLVTSAVDHQHGAASFRLEGQTRVAEGWVASLEGSIFVNGEDDPLGADFQDDSFARLKLTYFW